MRLRDVVDLLLLAALWGGSFLFMRVAAPEFPPPVMVVLRVGIAAACLVPVFAAVWGVLFLAEPVSGRMLAAGAIILLGTALATGLLKFGAAALPQASGAKP